VVRGHSTLVDVSAEGAIALVARAADASEAPERVNAVGVGIAVVIRADQTLVDVDAEADAITHVAGAASAAEASDSVGAGGVAVAVVRGCSTLVDVSAGGAATLTIVSGVARRTRYAVALEAGAASAAEARDSVGAVGVGVAVVRGCSTLVDVSACGI
jgi:hypothetical protein